MVAKSEIPHPIYKLNRSPPEISIMILDRRRRKQQQQQNKTETVVRLIWFLGSYDDDDDDDGVLLLIVIDWYKNRPKLLYWYRLARSCQTYKVSQTSP